jgi:hypothetical protein
VSRQWRIALRQSGLRVLKTRKGLHGSPGGVRPSTSSLHIVCSSNRILVAEMVMPRSQDRTAVLRDDLQDIRTFVGCK